MVRDAGWGSALGLGPPSLAVHLGHRLTQGEGEGEGARACRRRGDGGVRLRGGLGGGLRSGSTWLGLRLGLG